MRWFKGQRDLLQPEFEPGDPHDTKRELTRKNCPPAFTYVDGHVHTHTHIKMKMYILKQRDYRKQYRVFVSRKMPGGMICTNMLFEFFKKRFIYCILHE